MKESSNTEYFFKGYALNTFQKQAVDAIQQQKNVLVSAPTGAGKTLVAEFAIDLANKTQRRCIYTSPIKALSNQKYRDFRDDPNIDVGIMTGDVTINPGAKLLIMTTEILRNTLFEDPLRLRDLEHVIFDEIHYMDDLERGTVWEECIIFLPQEIKILGLSATIANIKQFGAWIESIRDLPLEIVTSNTRPVPLRHYLYHPAGKFFAPKDLRKVQMNVARNRGRWPPRLRDSTGLLNTVEEKKQLPTLYFCFSRRDCEVLADKNMHRKLLNAEEREKIRELFQGICQAFELKIEGDVGHLHRLASSGVGFHHAGMLPLHKELVERLFTSGLLKLLFTTETFAMGINMPAKVVIFDALRKFDGVSFNYLRTRDYMQMAGRAGRQGIDKQGLVYSLLDARDIIQAPLERIIHGRVEPIQSKFNLSYSTLLNLYEHLKGKLFDAWEKSFNFFQAKTQSPKKFKRLQRKQLALIEAKLNLLRELGYIDDAGVRERGQVAKQINGYELQVTEYLFRGLLDDMDPHQINALFAATIYEPRKGDLFDQPDPKILLEHKQKITQVIESILITELRLEIQGPIRVPAMMTVGVTYDWSRGKDFDDLFEKTNLAPGDLVRTFRMTLQLLRQLRKAIPQEKALQAKLLECMRLLNRDVVDAKRQLELG